MMEKNWADLQGYADELRAKLLNGILPEKTGEDDFPIEPYIESASISLPSFTIGNQIDESKLLDFLGPDTYYYVEYVFRKGIKSLRSVRIKGLKEDGIPGCVIVKLPNGTFAIVH